MLSTLDDNLMCYTTVCDQGQAYSKVHGVCYVELVQTFCITYKNTAGGEGDRIS